MGPCEAGKEQRGEVEERLPPDEEAAIGGVLGGFSHAQSPREDGHGVNVWVPVSGVGRGCVQVGHGVVGVVLGFPPLDGEALADVADEDSHQVAIGTGLEHLVMQEIVRQPAALLPEQGQQDGTDHVDREIGGHGGASHGSRKEQEIGCDFVDVVHGRSIE